MFLELFKHLYRKLTVQDEEFPFEETIFHLVSLDRFVDHSINRPLNTSNGRLSSKMRTLDDSRYIVA